MNRHFAILAGVVTVLICSPTLLAQAPVAVTGIVQDQTGAVVQGARVTLVRQTDASKRSASSSSDGSFRFDAVSPADYVLTVQMTGFENFQDVLTVGLESRRPMIVRLRVGTLEQEIIVEADSSDKLSTSASDAATTKIGDDVIGKLPVGSDDLMAVFTRFLSPAALPAEGVSLLVDGVPGEQLDLPSSSISNVRVDRNPYSAAFQHPGTARVEVSTKRGHRSRYDGALDSFLRTSLFAARNAFADSVPDIATRLVQPTLGGPLPGKKAAFFVAGQRFTKDESAVTDAVTAAGPFVANVPTSHRHDNIFTRPQWWPNDLQVLAATYTFNDQVFKNRDSGGFNLPERGVGVERRKHKVTVTHSLLSPSGWQNNIIFGFTHEEDRTGAPAAAPGIVVNDAFAAGPSPSFVTDNKRTVDVQNVTRYYARARHSLLFGARVRADQIATADATNFGGTFEFGSLQAFIDRTPLTFRINQGDPNIAYGVYLATGFAQDEIRVTPQLTLTFGLRYDWQSTIHDRDNVAPRLAFAFAPGRRKRTVVRGGAGTFYDNLPRAATERSLLVDGVQVHEVVIARPAFPDPFGSGETVSPPPSTVRIAPDLRAPSLTQASIGIEQEVWAKSWLTTEYSVLRGDHLFRTRNINAPLPDTGLRPNPAFVNVNQVESTAFQRTEALAVTFQGHVGKVFQPYARYILSKTTNDTSGTFSLPADNYDLGRERGPADFDARHRFNLMGIVSLPRAVQLGILLSASSGVPFNITTGFDDNGDTVANDRPPGVTRNTGRGPATVQLDARLSKNFTMNHVWRGSQRRDVVTIGVDVFNAINHTNVTGVVGVQASPFFGRANSAAPARVVQFSARYSFRQ